MFLFGAIASAHRKAKANRESRRKNKSDHKIHSVSKQQYYAWISEGRCGCCGAESGEFHGICDECRWS